MEIGSSFYRLIEKGGKNYWTRSLKRWKHSVNHCGDRSLRKRLYVIFMVVGQRFFSGQTIRHQAAF